MSATSPSGSTSEPKKSRGGLVGWIAEYPLAAATIGGGVMYAVMRLTQARFYGHFAVDPEEVGLGYTDTLVRGVLGVLLVGVYLLIPLLLIALYGGITAFRHEENKRKREKLGTGLWLYRLVRDGVSISVAFGAVSLVVVLIWSSENRASSVKAGHSVRPSHVRLDPLTWLSPLKNPLAIRAERVDVEWIASQPEPSALTNCGRCRWIYLGRASGIAVLYDVDACRTLRLPDANLVLVRTSEVASEKPATC